MQATPVLEAFIAKVREINYQGSYYLRTTQVPDKAAVRDKLAAMAGCSPGELCITRNTTESLDTVIAGYDWKAGDEAVMAEQDYGHMLAQFRLMARRHGIVNKRRQRADRSEVRRRDRPALRQRHHAAHAAADGVAHGQHHRADPAGAQDRRHGARARAWT